MAGFGFFPQLSSTQKTKLFLPSPMWVLWNLQVNYGWMYSNNQLGKSPKRPMSFGRWARIKNHLLTTPLLLHMHTWKIREATGECRNTDFDLTHLQTCYVNESAIILANTQIHRPDKRKNPNEGLSLLQGGFAQQNPAKLWLLCSFPPNVSSYCNTSPCCLEPGRKPPQIKPLCRSNQLNRRCCGRRRSTWPNGKFVSSKVVQVLSSNVHSPPGQHLGQKVRNYPTHFDVVVKWKPQLRKIIEKRCHRPLEKGQKFLFR